MTWVFVHLKTLGSLTPGGGASAGALLVANDGQTSVSERHIGLRGESV